MGLESWTMQPAGDVNAPFGAKKYRVMHRESGKGSFSIDSSQEQMRYLVDWSERYNFLDDLLGWGYIQGTTLRRSLPAVHPEAYNFYATDADVEPAGQSDVSAGLSYWKKALISVTFRPVTYDVLADDDIDSEMDRFVIREYDTATESLTLTGMMKFVGSGTVLNTQPTVLQSYRSVKYTWLQVPARYDDPFFPPVQTAIDNCAGKINSTPFDGNPAGTVLFVKPQTRMTAPKLSSGDNYYWEFVYETLVRNQGESSEYGQQIGHNFIYDITADTYDLVTHNGLVGGQRLYQSANLNTLFSLA